MAITRNRRGDVRDIRALATRVHHRWLEYRRRHPGMSVPISDTLSRILEHDPDYLPVRGRSTVRQRPPLQNPGVFTLKTIAEALETTVGDLLGEQGYSSIRDAVSIADRYTLRQAVELLGDLFDLDDEALLAPDLPQDDEPFLVPAAEFLARDHAYPVPMHAWVVSEGDPAYVRSPIREVHTSHAVVVRVVGDSMEPELRDGWRIMIDTDRTTPEPNALVAVYVRGIGALLGRWHSEGETISLQKSNPNYEPVTFSANDEWVVWGTATRIVDAPLSPRQ